MKSLPWFLSPGTKLKFGFEKVMNVTNAWTFKITVVLYVLKYANYPAVRKQHHQTSEGFFPHRPCSSPLGTLFGHFSVFSGCLVTATPMGLSSIQKSLINVHSAHTGQLYKVCTVTAARRLKADNFLSRGSKNKNHAFHQSPHQVVVSMHQVSL